MKKRWFLVGITFLLVPGLLVGCGVAQEKYDSVVAGLGKAQEELESLKDDYDKLTTEYENLQDTSTPSPVESEKPEAEYEDLQAEINALIREKESLEADYNQLNTENAAVLKELTEIKESHESIYQELSDIQAVYPPKHFSTAEELKSWVRSNAVSDTPVHQNLLLTYDAYARALEIQEAALKDGYIVSVAVYSHSTGQLFIRRICCMASCDDGIYYWFPDRDDIELSARIVTWELNVAGDPVEIEPRLEFQ